MADLQKVSLLVRRCPRKASVQSGFAWVCDATLARMQFLGDSGLRGNRVVFSCFYGFSCTTKCQREVKLGRNRLSYHSRPEVSEIDGVCWQCVSFIRYNMGDTYNCWTLQR